MTDLPRQQASPSSTEELQTGVAILRAGLGDSIDELGQRPDAPARAKQRLHDVPPQVYAGVGLTVVLGLLVIWRRRR